MRPQRVCVYACVRECGCGDGGGGGGGDCGGSGIGGDVHHFISSI